MLEPLFCGALPYIRQPKSEIRQHIEQLKSLANNEVEI